MIEKACPVVFRIREERMEVLAFTHPSAGKQFVKGSIQTGERPRVAAERELREESGLRLQSPMMFLGKHEIGEDLTPWHFFACQPADLPDVWQHATEDDHGHTFSFFWHPVDRPLDGNWHPVFHEAFAFFAPRLPVA